MRLRAISIFVISALRVARRDVASGGRPHRLARCVESGYRHFGRRRSTPRRTPSSSPRTGAALEGVRPDIRARSWCGLHSGQANHEQQRDVPGLDLPMSCSTRRGIPMTLSTRSPTRHSCRPGSPHRTTSTDSALPKGAGFRESPTSSPLYSRTSSLMPVTSWISSTARFSMESPSS